MYVVGEVVEWTLARDIPTKTSAISQYEYALDSCYACVNVHVDAA